MLKVDERNDNANYSSIISSANGNLETTKTMFNPQNHFEPKLDYQVLPILESDTEALVHQIAGHSRTGVLKHKLGYVLKPLQKEPLGTREVGFYTKVYQLENECENNDCINATISTPNQDGDGDHKTRQSHHYNHIIQKYLPKFYGVMKIHSIDTESGVPIWKYYIALQDLVEGFLKPCVIDIKVGAQTWDPSAPPKKVAHEKSKYIGTKEPLGLSLTGMQYFDLQTQKTTKMQKELGKTLDVAGFVATIYEFLNRAHDPTIPNYIAKKLLPRLKEIAEYFQHQREFCFYSSSLLIGYDASKFEGRCKLLQQSNWGLNEENDIDNTNSWLRVCMIDFAHVIPMEDENPGLDTNYQFGLHNLINVFNIMEMGASTEIPSSSSDSE